MNEQTHKLVSEAFALADVVSFPALSLAYTLADQQLMKSGQWDPNDPTLLINRIKSILFRIDPDDLPDFEEGWRAEILWFWHHHAISYAIWKAKDRCLAQKYATQALMYQGISQAPGRGIPNMITRLLDLLVHDKVAEAKVYADGWPADMDEAERETGMDLIRQYEAGQFF